MKKNNLISLILSIFIISSVGYVIVTKPSESNHAVDSEYDFAVFISDGGEYILGSDTRNWIGFFSNNSATPIWTKNIPCDFAALSENGDYVFVGGREGLFVIKENGDIAWAFVETIRGVAMSDNGDYFVAGTPNGAYLFSLQDNTPIWISSVGSVSSVAMSDNGDYFTYVTSNNLSLFNRKDNILSWVYTTGEITSVAISGNANYLSVGSSISTNLLIFDDNLPIWSSEYRNPGLKISSDGRVLGINSKYLISVYDRVENNLIVTKGSRDTFNLGDIGSIDMSSDGNYLALGVTSFGPAKTDNFIALFSVSENRVLWVY